MLDGVSLSLIKLVNAALAIFKIVNPFSAVIIPFWRQFTSNYSKINVHVQESLTRVTKSYLSAT